MDDWIVDSGAALRTPGGAPARVSCGLALISVGGVGLIVGSSSTVPVVLPIVMFGVASFGMGVGFSAVSVAMLSLAPRGHEGDASASLALTDNLFFAVTAGIGGALINLATVQGWSLRTGIVLVYIPPVVVGALGVLVAQRLPRGPARQAEPESPTPAAANDDAISRRYQS